MKKAVVALLQTQVQANIAVENLQMAGFNNSDISILFPDKNLEHDLGHEKHSKSPEGASAGAGTGMVLGGALGLLAGIGALTIPGVGPLVAAGPIMAALSGAAVGGAAGGLTGGLIGLGIPEFEAKQYEGKLRDGNLLMSVHCESDEACKRAEEILKNAGAEHINRTAEEKVNRK